MRILFVLYHFHPKATVAATRATRMLEGLVHLGIEPVVLTPGASEQRGQEAVGEVSVDVIRFAGSDPLAALHRSPSTGAPDRSVIRRKLKKGLRSLWLPDERRSLIKPWITTGKTLRRESFDAVYSSMTPASTGFVAKALAQHLQVPWIMEMRDLWSKNPYSPQTSNPLSSWITDRWERDQVHFASKVVVLTGAHQRVLQDRYPRLRDKICLIPNMFKPLTTPRKQTGDVLRIMYAGTLYADRTLAPLGRALDSLGRVEGFSSLQLEVGGQSNSASWSEVLGGEGKNRVLHGLLPQARVQELLLEVNAGVLNNPARDSVHVPGKFYDYLAAGLPMIDLSSQPDMRTLAEGAVPVWQSPGGNPDELHQILRELALWWRENPNGAKLPDAGHPLSQQRVTGQLAELLRTL